MCNFKLQVLEEQSIQVVKDTLVDHNAPGSEGERKHQETLEQFEKYSTNKVLLQKAEGNGWTLYKLSVVFN